MSLQTTLPGETWGHRFFIHPIFPSSRVSPVKLMDPIFTNFISQILKSVLVPSSLYRKGRGGVVFNIRRWGVDMKPSTGVPGMGPFWLMARGAFGSPVFILRPQSNLYCLLLSFNLRYQAECPAKYGKFRLNPRLKFSPFK